MKVRKTGTFLSLMPTKFNTSDGTEITGFSLTLLDNEEFNSRNKVKTFFVKSEIIQAHGLDNADTIKKIQNSDITIEGSETTKFNKEKNQPYVSFKITKIL